MATHFGLIGGKAGPIADFKSDSRDLSGRSDAGKSPYQAPIVRRSQKEGTMG